MLWTNSRAEDVTMFTDETVSMAGPVREGPTLHEWAGLDGRVFPDRRTQGEYLRWVHESAVADLPEGDTVHHHWAARSASTWASTGPPTGTS